MPLRRTSDEIDQNHQRGAITVLLSWRLLLTLVVLLVVGTHLFRSWYAVSPFKGFFADGPFQLYNALRRIDAGQLPGHDFPAFHGLGIPLAHYPFYRLLGGDLIGSELTRQLLSRLTSAGVYLLISWLLTRRLWLGVIWLVVRAASDALF